jgi:hypothetical protein
METSQNPGPTQPAESEPPRRVGSCCPQLLNKGPDDTHPHSGGACHMGHLLISDHKGREEVG